MKWAVGVTTAPRDESYLDWTLAACESAGWPPVVFNDAEKTLGPWGNFLRSAAALADRPVDAIIMLQDDVLLAKNLRPWLEKQLAASAWWSTCGIISLYSCEGMSRDLDRGWNAIPWRYVKACGSGACAVLMRRQVAQRILDDPPAPSAFCLTDVWLKRVCYRERLDWIEHCPSLCRHVGVVSALVDVPGERRPRSQPKWTPYRHEGVFVEDAGSLAD